MVSHGTLSLKYETKKNLCESIQVHFLSIKYEEDTHTHTLGKEVKKVRLRGGVKQV